MNSLKPPWRPVEAALAIMVLSAPVAAQMATVTISHSGPTGGVDPGETVQFRVVHARSGDSILAGLGGSLAVTDNLGVASNLSSSLAVVPPDPGYTNSLGTPMGGSVLNVSHEFHSHPFFTPWIHPAYIARANVEVLTFDWTAPTVSTPTTINFDWIPSAHYPEVYAIIPPYGGFHWASLPTSYTGTSIIVLPTSPAAAIAIPLALLAGRRRRPCRR